MRKHYSTLLQTGRFAALRSLVAATMLCCAFLCLGTAQALANPTATPADTGRHAKQWQQVDHLLKNDYFDSAYHMASQLFVVAQREHDSRTMLTAAYYMSRAESSYRDDADDSTLARYQALLPRLAAADRMVCHAFLARLYRQCRDELYWRREPEITLHDESDDYTLWSTERFEQEIQRHLDSSLADTALLRSTTPAALQPLLRKLTNAADKPATALNTTPTLYESLMLHAMACSISPRQKEHYLNRLRAAHQASDEELRLYYDAEYVELRVGTPSLDHDKSTTAPSPAWVDSIIALYSHSTSPLLARLYLIKARAYRNGLWNHTLANPADNLKQAHDIALQGYRLSPTSDYGNECHNLALDIEQESITLNMRISQPSASHMLAVAQVLNVDTIYLRFVHHMPLAGLHADEHKAMLSKQPAVHSSRQAVPQGPAYQQQYLYLYLPPMPTGHYALLASSTPDFAPAKTAYCHVQCNDALFGEMPAPKDSLAYLLLHRTTGAALSHTPVELQLVSRQGDSNHVDSVLARLTTDSDGLLFLNKHTLPDYLRSKQSLRLYAPHTQTTETLNHHRYIHYPQHHDPLCTVVTDRPVYRAGEIVQYSLVQYHSNGYTQGQVLPNDTLQVWLLDPNRRRVDSITVATDSFGNARGSFLLPPDALPGRWQLMVRSLDTLKQTFRHTVLVEQYKQPKFSVALHDSHARHSFGTSVTIEGTAVAYTAMPVDGAKVAYTVERQELTLFRPYQRPQSRAAREVIAFGDTVTDGNGAFAFSFVPLPDSAADLSRKPDFEYLVTVRVTDRNGESHEQQSSLRIGYSEGRLVVATAAEVRELKQLRYQYLNLDGLPLSGTVQITLDELQPPQRPLLATRNLLPVYGQTPRHTIDSATFATLYPLFAYSDTLLDAAYWPVRRTRLALTHQADKAKMDNLVALPDMPAGTYRVTLRATAADGTTTETRQEIRFTPATARHVQSQHLLWSDLNATSLQPNDTLRIRLGSRHENVTVHCVIATGENTLRYSTHLINDNIETLCLPITEAMRGGLRVKLAAVKGNTLAENNHYIEVPHLDKQLTLRWETFRDKLQPQRQESWTLRVRDSLGNRPASANLLMTMYDAALNHYNTLDWSLQPWRHNVSWRGTDYWMGHNDYGWYTFEKKRLYNGTPFRTLQWELANSITPYRKARAYGAARGENGLMRTAKETSSDGILYEVAIQEETEEEVFCIIEQEETGHASSSSEPPLRSNLSTLAFFEPSLRTDDSGRVSILFTVPDLLTQWHIRGLAYTQDLKVGTLQAKAVTNKELMTVPNVPRFLRQGDNMDFVIKVSNASQEEQPVTVSLEMLDAATGKVLDIIMPLGSQSKADGMAKQTVQIAARSSQEVVFNLHVPQGELYAMTYRVVAHGERSSDGEQSVIPVLSNRTLVTESMSLYINGKEEKHYSLAHLKEHESNTLQSHSLTAEVTASPIWYALQALPYVEDYENPSNLYLSSQFYANTLARHLLQQAPQMQALFDAWRNETPNVPTSPLMQHEELKQVLLNETPWLRDGEDETARKQRIGLFFDSTSLHKNLVATAAKLRHNQMQSGAWTWIAGSRYENYYVTATILTDYGRLRSMVGEKTLRKANVNETMQKALAHIDKENYHHYLRCSKEKDDRTINTSYLYLRSLYTEKPEKKDYKKSLDYFYNNALRYHKEEKDLYSMAQLALVFHRHGDTKEAEKIVKRIKQRALLSDEMGMYWRDNVSGYRWNERPIEVQSLLIEAFATITPKDTESIARMQQWLLKQKQTTSWQSDLATVNAVSALLKGGISLDEKEAESVTMTVGGQALTTPPQAGTGYRLQRWAGDSITKEMADVTLTKTTDGIAWGALYWQYFEEMDKVPHSETGIKMQKKLYRVNKEGDLTLVDSTVALKVGNKVRVQILLDCDRNMEYLELKDNRTAAFEPLSTAAGWHWNGGLSYYAAVYDACSKFFIDRLDKGRYVLEYDLFVAASGEQLCMGTTTIQCLYAPEFRATTSGMVIRIER